MFLPSLFGSFVVLYVDGDDGAGVDVIWQQYRWEFNEKVIVGEKEGDLEVSSERGGCEVTYASINFAHMQRELHTFLVYVICGRMFYG